MKREDIEKSVRSLRPIDDGFMRVVMRDQPTLVEHVLRLVTGIELAVQRMETQRDLRALDGHRSLELDVWTTDTAGRKYNVEVQTGDSARPRRARYHASGLDVDALDAGQKFEMLPETYVVFIMEDDPYGFGAETYRFERADQEHGIPLADGAHVIYANAACDATDELGKLLSDFLRSDPDEMLDPLMRERVQWLKNTEGGRHEMSNVFEQIYEEGRQEGREEGREETLVENVRNLVERLRITAAEALDVLGVPKPEQARYLSML